MDCMCPTYKLTVHLKTNETIFTCDFSYLYLTVQSILHITEDFIVFTAAGRVHLTISLEII